MQEEQQQYRRTQRINEHKKQLHDLPHRTKSRLEVIKENKGLSLLMLALLLEVLISVVLVVLFMTLEYVGFGTVKEGQYQEKISFLNENNSCGNQSIIQKSKFISIKIKTAFVLLCVEFLLGFVNIIIGFGIVTKTVQKVTRSLALNRSILKNKTQTCALYLLVSLCMAIVIIEFGTYLDFLISGTTNKLQQQCRFTIINRQIIAITVLFAIKLLLYLVLWPILLCYLLEMNKTHSLIQYNEQGFRLPYINELRSILGSESPPGNQNKERLVEARNLGQIEGNFKQLKTEDFLFQVQKSKENQNNPRKNDAKSQENVKIQNEDQQSNRRMLLYVPDENEIVRKSNPITPTSKIQQQHDNLPQILIKKISSQQQRKHNSGQSLSVNNSLIKDNNNLLLINSVEKVHRDNYEQGILPFSSKKKSKRQSEDQLVIRHVQSEAEEVKSVKSKGKRQLLPGEVVRNKEKDGGKYRERLDFQRQSIKDTQGNRDGQNPSFAEALRKIPRIKLKKPTSQHAEQILKKTTEKDFQNLKKEQKKQTKTSNLTKNPKKSPNQQHSQKSDAQKQKLRQLSMSQKRENQQNPDSVSDGKSIIMKLQQTIPKIG